MGEIRSTTFGEITFANDAGGYWTRDVSLHGRSLGRSLFVGDGLGAAQLVTAGTLLDRLAELDDEAKPALLADLAEADGGVVRDFVTFHLEELEADLLASIFGASGRTTDERTFVDKLDLVSVAIHADGEDGLAIVLDYSLGKAHGDQVLAVKLDAEGSLVSVAHES